MGLSALWRVLRQNTVRLHMDDDPLSADVAVVQPGDDGVSGLVERNPGPLVHGNASPFPSLVFHCRQGYPASSTREWAAWGVVPRMYAPDVADLRIRELERACLVGEPGARAALLGVWSRCDSRRVGVRMAALCGDNDALAAVYGRVEPLHSVLRGPDGRLHALLWNQPSLAAIYAPPLLGALLDRRGRESPETLRTMCGLPVPRATAAPQAAIANCDACQDDPTWKPEEFFNWAWSEALCPIQAIGPLASFGREYCVRIASAAMRIALTCLESHEPHHPRSCPTEDTSRCAALAAGAQHIAIARRALDAADRWLRLGHSTFAQRFARIVVNDAPAYLRSVGPSAEPRSDAWQLLAALLSVLGVDGVPGEDDDQSAIVRHLLAGMQGVCAMTGSETLRLAVAREVAPWALSPR